MFSYWRELYEAQSLEERFTQKWNMSSFTRPHVAPNGMTLFFCGTQKEDCWREFSLKELSSSKNGCRSSSVANLGDLSPHLATFPWFLQLLKMLFFVVIKTHWCIYCIHRSHILCREYTHLCLTCIYLSIVFKLYWQLCCNTRLSKFVILV